MGDIDGIVSLGFVVAHVIVAVSFTCDLFIKVFA